MFGNRKLHQLESTLAAANERIAHLENVLRATTAALAGVQQASCIVALELIAKNEPALVLEKQLPLMSLAVVIHDTKKLGVGDEIATFSQTMAYSLQEFLFCPDVVSIENGRSYDISANHYPTRTMQLTTRYRGEMAACCGAIQALLKKVFEARLPIVSIDALNRGSQSATIEVKLGK